MADYDEISVTKESLWYIDNYVLIRDYYDRTVSRIAARCIRMGNIAVEDYPFYPYIIDVLNDYAKPEIILLNTKSSTRMLKKRLRAALLHWKKI